jgi:hypothetical protein
VDLKTRRGNTKSTETKTETKIRRRRKSIRSTNTVIKIEVKIKTRRRKGINMIRVVIPQRNMKRLENCTLIQLLLFVN